MNAYYDRIAHSPIYCTYPIVLACPSVQQFLFCFFFYKTGGVCTPTELLLKENRVIEAISIVCAWTIPEYQFISGTPGLMYLLIERLGSNRTNGARCWLER
jgi:hypothetical protein